jgi:chromosome segregation ATPase
MLTNKKINKKKTAKNDQIIDNNIKAMGSWVRKIEQTTNSIGSRLAAVERRISLNKDDKLINRSVSAFNNLEKPWENITSELKEKEYVENIVECIVNAFENKFAFIHDKIQSQHAEIQFLNEKIKELNKALDYTYKEIKKTKDLEIKFLADFKRRIEKIEKRSPPTIKIGNTEIPIEISGVIAGFISLLAAFLVSFNQQNILISPVFLAIIGLVFISSALFKSIRSTYL